MRFAPFLGFLCLAGCNRVCNRVTLNSDEDTLILKGVEIKDIGPLYLSELERNYDKYEAQKYSHGRFKEGPDITVKAEFTSESSTVPKSEVDNYIANSPEFVNYTSSLTTEEKELFVAKLKMAKFERRGQKMYRHVSLLDARNRVITVMIVITQLNELDDNDIDFSLLRLNEHSQTRLGVHWVAEFHDDAQNQRMLVDWCIYRLLLHLQAQDQLPGC